ncbi:MAG: hypothetical protein KI791_10425, partial [Cyclobacteriaceae bacterium]|nr:hypothetical protein [Cyclobacteriaceae bacterium SS2]
MGIIIQKRRHYLTRFILWSVIILLLGFSPVLVGAIGAWISELQTGVPCHEGNCSWMVLGWLTLITWPISAFIVFVLFVIV